ncbi:ATPase [Bifidobacterium samirii]|uniref:ATPase n=2 Tax=Bifidobacterium samirii TaxID=2306974 RepID=A0A430FP30_9BIFI|nr:ATPase [Bifidobacterium samirii]
MLRAGPPDATVLPDGVRTGVIGRNILTCTAASGGIGLSLTAALLARTLTGRDLTCTLVDADLTGGGLDILLGIEKNPGIRFDTLDAPLGQVDGDALNRGLPVWDDVRVLSHNPWNGPTPPWWGIQAAVRALSETNGIVIVDAGRGTGLADIPELEAAPRLLAAELSVLGLARAKPQLQRIRERHPESDVILVGIEPRGVGRQASGPVGVDEAEDYIGQPFDACMHADPKLCSDILSGLGAQHVARRNRLAIDTLGDRVTAMLERG